MTEDDINDQLKALNTKMVMFNVDMRARIGGYYHHIKKCPVVQYRLYDTYQAPEKTWRNTTPWDVTDAYEGARLLGTFNTIQELEQHVDRVIKDEQEVRSRQ